VLGVGLEPAVGEEGVELVGRGDGRKSGEEVAEVGEGFDVVGLAGGDQTEEDRGATAAGFAGDEEPVLAADGRDLDRLFTLPSLSRLFITSFRWDRPAFGSQGS